MGVFVVAAVALPAYQAPRESAATAGGKGVWYAVFILCVVWPAILLYRIGVRAGAFAALREGIGRFSRNELFLVLAFGRVFASFWRGIAAFGVPIAVVARLCFSPDADRAGGRGRCRSGCTSCTRVSCTGKIRRSVSLSSGLRGRSGNRQPGRALGGRYPRAILRGALVARPFSLGTLKDLTAFKAKPKPRRP